jgi:hypothetical protein
MASRVTLDEIAKMHEALEQMLSESNDDLHKMVLENEAVLQAARAARLTPERYTNGVFASLASACVRIQQRLNLGALPTVEGISGMGFAGGPAGQRAETGRSVMSCSFCGKLPEQVQRLIAGPHQVSICNECVALCQQILQQ